MTARHEKKKTGTRRPGNCSEGVFFQHGCVHRYKENAEFVASKERHCWLSIVCWGVEQAFVIKTSTKVNPDAESTSKKGFTEAWLRPHSPTGQGLEFRKRCRAGGGGDECDR